MNIIINGKDLKIKSNRLIFSIKFSCWLLQLNQHTYIRYITRTFNRRTERLIHRQRLTSVDRRCSTIFFFFVSVFLPSNQRCIQCRYAHKMYIGKKKTLKTSQEKCDQNKRERESDIYSRLIKYWTYTIWTTDIVQVYRHTYIHTRFPFPLLLLLLLKWFKEKGVNYTHEEAEKK